MNTLYNPDSPIKNSPQNVTLLLALLSLIVILIYADSLTTPFVFDDIPNIRDNPHIRVASLTLKNLLQAGFLSPESKRPVANISFALDYYFHGSNLVGFHLVNILIHIFSGIFLYFLVKATFETPVMRPRFEKSGWIPFFAAFIWLVHPLQTQSVTYLVQRMNSLAAMFYVLSMLFYVKFRLSRTNREKWPLLTGCIFAAILAAGTKQISASLPVFLFLYECYFFQGLRVRWNRRHLIILVGLLLVLILFSLIYMGADPVARIFSAYKYRDFTLTQRVLTQFRIVVFYISLLLWPMPSRLNLDHDFALSYSLIDPVTTLIAVIVIIAFIVLAIVTARRNPLLSYGILWFFGNLVIESSVIGLELVFEHRNYLPSMFAIPAMVALIWRYAKPRWSAAVCLCVVGALFSVWTFERNRVWADELLLYRDCVEKSPAKARPHNNLGAVLLRRGRLSEAVAEFQKALRIKPDYADAQYNLGNAMAGQGDLKQALYCFSAALRLQPGNIKILNNMGATLVLLGRFQEAIDCFQKALGINPADAELHKNLAIALKKQGDQTGTMPHFSRTFEVDPENRETIKHGK